MTPAAPSPESPAPNGLPPAAARTVPLPDAGDEARAFWRMRRQFVTTFCRQALARSRFRLLLIGVLSALLWGGLFWLCLDGFHFLQTGIPHPDTHDETVRAVFGMFFAALMVMLVFSSGIILYSSLFRARDITFLLTTPAHAERIFLHKFQESILMSSWAFVLLGSPMLLAYGLQAAAPWYYFALLLPFLVAFIYVPASAGAILCMAIVRWLPGRRMLFVVLAGLATIGVAAWLGWSVLACQRDDLLTPLWFQEMLSRMELAQQQLLPSWWLSSGLLEAARGEWAEGVLFLTLMISNALFCRQLAVWISGWLYRAGYNALNATRTARKRPKAILIDRLVARFAPMPYKMRLLVVKDMRLFRRDPTQWSQFLIFFGLLGLYFLNIRRLSYSVHYLGWVNMVSFLNLSVVGLLLSTFTTRFIFPMISLEGRRFWILGLLPIRRDSILWSKFLFATGGSIVPCSLLILLSDLMLRVWPMVLAIHQLTCVILCLGLSGIAVGLGAIMPSLREESPSRIAAGFGGTLNLVLSTGYILVVVMLTALPCHFYLAAVQSHAGNLLASRPDVQWWLNLWLVLGTVGSVLLGIVATVVPLWMGFRAFRKLEF